jgi:hypothetical protein
MKPFGEIRNYLFFPKPGPRQKIMILIREQEKKEKKGKKK